MEAFRPRPIRPLGVATHGDWRLKRYAIAVAEPAADAARDGGEWADFAAGRGLALAELPAPARTAARPGLGFVIEHRGAGADYVVLGWWDRENELPVRVVVRDQRPGAVWRTAGASESFCVWDLQVIGFERDAYVATVLAPEAGQTASDDYLATFLDRPAGGAAEPGSRG